MKRIDRFTGRYSFLSNFYIESDGFTLEHRFQAAKTTDPVSVAAILAAPTASRAKRMGRNCKLRDDWETIKLSVMRTLVHAKFQEPRLRAMLEATGDAELLEGNSWNDTFWGVNFRTGHGKNHLGKILMEVREDNRVEES